MSRKWQRVTADDPCPVCGKSDWCRRMTNATICNRVMSDLVSHDEGGGWLHDSEHYKPRAVLNNESEGLAEYNWKTDRETHAAYTELLGKADGLSANHCTILQSRGVDALHWRGYRSWNPNVPHEFSDACLGVPGFHQALEQPVQCTAPAGILVPHRNRRGNITGIQARVDHVLKQSKYLWLSSDKWPGGVKATTRIHWAMTNWQANPYELYITEGAIKADSIAANLDANAIAMPGISMTAKLCNELTYWGALPHRAIIALDQDGNEHTEAAKNELARRLKLLNVKHVQILEWDEGPKGVDDAIVAGAKLRLINV